MSDKLFFEHTFKQCEAEEGEDLLDHHVYMIWYSVGCLWK